MTMLPPTNDILKVLPKGRPDHISLDFDRLRAEGIRLLENLATEVWTDFNAHDPGITILELLCYALTDLGYRARMLPIQDIAAGPGGEKPWFEAVEILPMSPVTARNGSPASTSRNSANTSASAASGAVRSNTSNPTCNVSLARWPGWS